MFSLFDARGPANAAGATELSGNSLLGGLLLAGRPSADEAAGRTCGL